ncbi:hypothetical protein ACK3SF_01755 [Candidatus Nanosalina sp. VS9-1]|uniref:hypothetical protein n=1 Tax=Candidatus Nanosalina sp. VS9-1 TaxID=3388566 RepID=UPI0039DF3645
MDYRDREVYGRLTDSELEYSLKRSAEMMEEAVQSFMASLYLQDTRNNLDSLGFDRLVLGLSGDEVDDAEEYMNTAKFEYDKALREASSREKDFSDHMIDEDEMLVETREWIEELTFDRIGLSGIARNL